jgi:hypothetical protein
MSLQLKKKAIDLGLNQDEKSTRPNIDHLIKRIKIERRRERNSSIAIIFLTFSGIVIISLGFL